MTTLTEQERNFLEHYTWEIFGSMEGPATRWLADNHLTILDFGSLLRLYSTEGDPSRQPAQEITIPWTPEQLRARNRELVAQGN